MEFKLFVLGYVAAVTCIIMMPDFQVYVINLARRPERRKRMSAMLDELGYNYTIFTAVDGRYTYIAHNYSLSQLHSGITASGQTPDIQNG